MGRDLVRLVAAIAFVCAAVVLTHILTTHR